MPYSLYTWEEFVADSPFRQWILSPTPELEQFWSAFLSEYPQQATTVAQARQVIERLAIGTMEPDQATNLAEAELIWHNIWQQVSESPVPLRTNRWVWGAAAASVVLLLLGGWWYWNWSVMPGGVAYPKLLEATMVGAEEHMNRGTLATWLTLSDGSRVLLEPNSRLSYPSRFAADRRVVSLSGGAFFEVVRNPKQPFVVYARQTITKVLGTSFRVSAFEQTGKVSVAVRTGRVSVYAPRQINEQPTTAAHWSSVLLTPNQQAVFDTRTAQLNKELVDTPKPLPMPGVRREFVFDDKPVTAVFAQLETLYGIDIVFDAEVLAQCPVTTTFSSDEGLFRQLTLVCQAIGANYELVDGQIIINSKGCTP